MYRRIALISLALFGILLGAAWMTPDTWYVERETQIAATPELIWSWVAAPSKYTEWTAWNGEDDPSFSSEHFGGTDGSMSGYRWTSRDSVGELLVADSEPFWRVTLKGTAERRFPVTGFIELTPLEDGMVEVRWAEQGELGWDPLMRLFRPLIEKHIKTDFDEGLTRLKGLAEAAHRAQATPEPHPNAPVGTLAPPAGG